MKNTTLTTQLPMGVDQGAWPGLDLMASMVWVIDLEGRILFANMAVQDQLGLPRHMFLGQSLRDWLEHPDELDRALKAAGQGNFTVLRCDSIVNVGQDSVAVHMVVAPVEGSAQEIGRAHV